VGLLFTAPDADIERGASHDVARERKERPVYPCSYSYALAQAHQAKLRQEAAQQRLARQGRTARQGVPQPQGTTLLDQCRGAIARLRAWA
jgi:hypothetical protein